MTTNGNPSPSEPTSLTPEELFESVCLEIQDARSLGEPVHRYRFAQWGHVLGLSIEQTIALTGLTQVDYGPRVSPAQWEALAKTEALLNQLQADSQKLGLYDL